MIKFRLYFDKDKETAWLNQMAKDGFAMTGFAAGFFTFEACEPGKYTYQIDFGSKLFSVSEDYREFMSEQGIEIIQSWGFWIILRKLSHEGDFQLYTDVDSSIAHYTKIRNMFKVVAVIELICFMVECFAAEAGNVWAGFFAILLGIFALVFMKMALQTNQIIRELKERKGDYSEHRNSHISPLLFSGMLLNSFALILSESISSPVKTSIQILAIVLMLAGLYRSKNFF